MAIYHLSAQIISREQGRSSVAASAYRAAEKITDERTGLTHDFTKKKDVAYKEIFLPSGAPQWLADRACLWNHVEKIEKRKDAQLVREFNISLPLELTLEQNIALAREFVQKQFVDKGMVADLAIHTGDKGQEQPHCHVMLSLREVTQNGFGNKVRDWNKKQLIYHWREQWAEYCNHHLAIHGHDVRIDHRTLKAQGIDLEPQNKIGAKTAFKRMTRYEDHQQIAFENGNRILNNPKLALDAITRQQSTFTHQDIARIVNRYTRDEAQFTEVYAAVKACPDLVFLGTDEKKRERFTTQEMLNLETTMVKQALIQLNQHHHAVNLTAQTQALQAKGLSAEQKQAFDHLVNSGDIACIVGFAGTGKSYMLGAAREAWEQAGYNVVGMTLSGIAAQNLEASSGIQSHTIDNRLVNWKNERQKLTAQNIVVIDEAGMVGSKQMATIINEAYLANAKVVLIGDPEQLQAIAAGAAFRAILERVGFVEMVEIQRQQQIWQQEATKALASNKTADALNAYYERHHLHEYDNKQKAITAMIEQWQETRSNEPDKSQIMLTYTRNDMQSINEQARALRKAQGELGQDYPLETASGEKEFAVGDRIYFLRNEKNLNVKNGTLGTIEKIKRQQLTVRLDTEKGQAPRRVKFHINYYYHIDHGYAATIYKAQGVTVDRSYILASKYFDRHATYVALSRHREGAEIFWSKNQFYDFNSLQQTFSRERLKDTSLDYGLTRGCEITDRENLIQKHHKQKSPLSQWLSPEYKHEWEKLKSIRNSKVDLMVQFYEVALNKQSKGKEFTGTDKIAESMANLMGELKKNPKIFPEIEKNSPQLARSILNHSRAINKGKDRGMDIEMEME